MICKTMADLAEYLLPSITKAKVYYAPNFLDNSEDHYNYLRDTLPFEQGQVRVYGKVYDERRLTLTCSDTPGTYKYSGKTMVNHEWISSLRDMRDLIKRNIGIHYDTVLVNYYRDGSDKIGKHSDTEIAKGSSVACISLGATRNIVFRSKVHKEVVKLPLHSGSLLIMGENCQENYTHEINEEKGVDGRISLTYRVT